MKYNKVLAIILSGGKGTRLYPLTKVRCKPAISFGGKYRLIDIPISNCLHSGINQIFILTQFMTASIHRHIFQTYRLDMLSKGFIEILPAEQTHTGEEWYQGTADAVRHSVRYIQNFPIQDVLILSGDQICLMDFGPMLDFHRKNKAGLTVIGSTTHQEDIHRLGLIKSDESGKVTELLEKPQDSGIVKGFKNTKGNFLASTGNYIFKRDVLLDILQESQGQDFGKEIIPCTIKRSNVYVYPFDGYWEDIGTIKSFYHANLHLASPLPKLNFYDEERPVFTHARFLPAAKVQNSQIRNSLISEGSLIEGAVIEESVIGIRSVIHSNTLIRKSILFGNDYFSRSFGRKKITPYVGENVVIERAIIDKNVIIGKGAKVIGTEGAKDEEQELYCVRDGIVIISKGAVIPPGRVITPGR